MKLLNKNEIQQIGKCILLYIKDVCDSNNISFYLAYGTVIGAMRHKGFIPWDDDIDIYMYRQEYEKFKKIISGEPSRYKLLDIDICNNYYMPQVKMLDTWTSMKWHIVENKFSENLGVWVDIYVLDNVPDNNEELKQFHKKLNFLQACYRHSIYKTKVTSLKSLLSCIALCWTKLIGPRFFSKIMVSLSKSYNDIETKRIAPSSFTASSREQAVLDRCVIGKGTAAEFEGTMFLVPEQTDVYLKHFYGNYMELPPIEKRISNHTADFYLIDGKENVL